MNLNLNRICRLSVVIGFATSTLHAADEPNPEGAGYNVEYQLIFPDEKAPEIVKVDENNPFVAVMSSTQSDKTENSEENAVKERLLSLRVTGLKPSPKGLRLMLGDMILEAGMLVPPLISAQTVQLRVNSITRNSIEFIWLEKQRTGLPARTLIKSYDLEPYVAYQMYGQKSEKDKDEASKAESEMLMGYRSERTPGRFEPHRPDLPATRSITIEEKKENKADTAEKSQSSKPKSESDRILDMFFNDGNAKSGDNK